MDNWYKMTKLAQLQSLIAEVESHYGRTAGSVRLIAVSKTRSAEEILDLYRLGQRAFGENYLQEAQAKQTQLHEQTIEWHFVGAVQSRKAKQVAENFEWVHSVDRIKLANKLNQARAGQAPLKVLIQVNLESEEAKGGVSPEALPALAHELVQLPNLKLRGLMFMPRVHNEFDAQRAVFRRAKTVFDELKQEFVALDQLSMGMTGDMKAAIAEGATMVRIGTALFGARQ